MTINRLMNLPFRRLTENELNWLKNRTKDSREEVRTLAKEIYSIRFPHAERNQMKKQLYVKELSFTVNACTWDEYGDEVSASCQFDLRRTEPVITMKVLDGSSESVSTRLDQGECKRLLKSLVHYYEIFCWNQDYCTNTDLEDIESNFECDDFDPTEFEDIPEKKTNTEELNPTWSLSVKYTDGTEQNIYGTDEYLPDKVGELFLYLTEFFAPEEEPDWEQDDFNESDV